MKKKPSDRLFEVPVAGGQEPYEDSALPARTNFQSRAPRAGADFKSMAVERLKEAGATVERLNLKAAGFPVDAQILGSNGRRFLVLARGTPEEQRFSGLRRTDTVEKVGFVAMQLARRQRLPVLLITSDLPNPSTKTARYLAALSKDVWDVVAYRADLRGFQRLHTHLHGPADTGPPQAPWRQGGKDSQATLEELDE